MPSLISSRTTALLGVALALSTAGCTDRTTPRTTISRPTTIPDLGDGSDLDLGVNDTVAQLCRPGLRRCLFESSPVYERCAESGQRFETESCADGEICRDAQCVPFSCTPGRTVCLGGRTLAECDPTGQGVRDVRSCAEDEVCQGGTCADPCTRAADQRSYLGCSYTAIELINFYRGGEVPSSPYGVVLGNPSRLTDAWVQLSRHARGAAGTETRVPLLDSVYLEPSEQYRQAQPTTVSSGMYQDGEQVPLERDAEGRVRVPAGRNVVLLLRELRGGPFRIQSTQPIAAYQFSPYCCNFTASNDASLLLPDATLGTRYRVVGYPSLINNAGHIEPYITVVATKPDTTVTLRGPVPLRFTSGKEPEARGDAQVVTLQAGELVTMSATEPTFTGRPPTLTPSRSDDLSGTVVEADQPVAVYSGHPCTFIPTDRWACDHLEEQLFPASTLGTRYLLTTARRRSFTERSREAIYWRIVADEPATIRFSPPLDTLWRVIPSNESSQDCAALLDEEGVLRLGAGEVCEMGLRDPVAVESDAPLIIGGFLSGHESTGITYYGTQAGDPAFFLATPVRQFRTDYAFVMPPTFKKSYAAVMAPKGVQIALDGVGLLNEQRLQLAGVTLGDEEWEVYHLALSPGVHSLSAERRFGVVVYAYDDFVSYAFPGGLDLRPPTKE